MTQYAIFAQGNDKTVEPYGYCKNEATALGKLIFSMHHTVQMEEPEKYGKNELDIEMSGIEYFVSGFSIQMTVREKQTYHTLCELTGYVIMIDEIKTGEEEE